MTRRLLDNPNPGHRFLRQMQDFQPVIIEMERNGFCIDLAMLKEVGQKEQKKLEDIERDLLDEIAKDGLSDFNLASSQQKYQYIFSLALKNDWKREWARFFKNYNPWKDKNQEEFRAVIDACFEKLPSGLGYKPIPEIMTKEGLSTNKDLMVLVERANLRHPRAGTFRKFQESSKKKHFINTYIDGIQKQGFIHDDGRFFLHPSYNQTFAVTGRLTCSGPNMQNWPQERKFLVREAVRSRFKGGCIAKADLSQIEIRVAGWYYDIPQMRLDYERGIDIHGENAKVIYGEGFTDTQRTDTKTCTFKIAYAGTPYGIVTDPKIPIWSMAEAESIVNGIGLRYPEWFAGREDDLAFVKEHGYFDSPSTFRFDFRGFSIGGVPALDHFGLKNRVANYPIQHLAATLIYSGLISLFNAMKERRLKSLLFSTVHDDVAVDVFPGEEEIVQELLTYHLTDGMVNNVNRTLALGWDFPLGVEVHLNDHWA